MRLKLCWILAVNYLILDNTNLRIRMATLDDFKNRFQDLNDDFMLFTSKSNPATAAMIQNYEAAKGLQFNEEVREFLLTFGSLILEVKEEIWKRPEEFDVLPSWKFGYGFFVYGLSSDENFPDWLSYEEKYDEAEKSNATSLGQLFFKRSGNLYRAYVNGETITVEYDKFGDDREVFNGNFYDFLIAEVDTLEKDYVDYLNEK